MKATFSCAILKKIISLLKGIVNDVSLHFECDALYIREVDPLHTAAYLVKVLPVDINGWLGPVVFGFNVAELHNLLRLTTKQDQVEFSVASNKEIIVRCVKEDQLVNWKAVFGNNILPVHAISMPNEKLVSSIYISRSLLLSQLIWASYWIGSDISMELKPSENELMFKGDASESQLVASATTFEWRVVPEKEYRYKYLSKYIVQILRKDLDKNIQVDLYENGVLVLHYKVGMDMTFTCLLSPITASS